MLPYFILGIALLTGLLLSMRWYVSADPKTLVKVLKWLSLGLIIVIGLFLALTGRLAWAFITLPVLLGWIMRFRSAATMFKNFSRMTAGAQQSGASEVETRFLRMNLDHASGTMDGEILEGHHKGRLLSEVGQHAVVGLLKVCWSEDEQSAQILEAYLDRYYPNWRIGAEKKTASNKSFKDEMDRSEAFEILGLSEEASDEQIKEAYHRLIAGLHPDHGGSTYLAAKINRAKDVLLS
ncbi:MAG: DnaJ domain-containing protein [Rhodospirillaceae bacterium]|nr:DnaJ domain-containing protein [Rhodospirillaceae bacterium]MBL6931059.1 DnaJ domain-containing protein [Rhodospirillales bacterium]